MATDTIMQPAAAAKGPAPEPYDLVCDMEEPLARLRDLLTGMMYLGQSLGDGGAAVCRIAEIARDECDKSSSIHDALFHDLNPNKGAAL
jgi:hypothetical protein